MKKTVEMSCLTCAWHKHPKQPCQLSNKECLEPLKMGDPYIGKCGFRYRLWVDPKDVACATCWRKRTQSGCDVVRECLWEAMTETQEKTGKGHNWYNHWMPKEKAKFKSIQDGIFTLVDEPGILDVRKVEDKMYRSTDKALRVKHIINSSTPSDGEKCNFIETMLTDFGYKYSDTIAIGPKFLSYVKQHPCFIDWLMSRGYIEEEEQFRPFTLELPITTKEELWSIYHRFNAGGTYFKDYIGATTTKVPFKKDSFGNRRVQGIGRLWTIVKAKCKEVL